MNWYHYMLIAYAAAGVVVWIRHTLILFNILGGKAPDEVPKDLREEIHSTIEEINAYQSPLIWLAASVLIVGAVALNLLRYIVVWPRVVYKRWRKSIK